MEFDMKLDADNKARLAFTVALIVCAAAAADWYFLSATRYTAYQIRTHDPVSGLLTDAPVEYHGVDVGRVKRVELTDPQTVRIILSVERAAPVTAATVATITSRGLAARGFTGYVYVSLESMGEDTQSLAAGPGEEYPVIPLTAPKSVSLDTAISRMDENVQLVVDRMNRVLDTNTIASLKESANNLQRVTKTLADNNAKLNALIVNGERVTRQLQPLLDSSNETVNALQREILPETHRALTSLDQLSRELQPLVVSSNDTLNALQTQVLPEAHKTLADLDDLSTSLSGFATKVRKDPSVIVRGPAPPPLGPGEGK
jgi:phospholipid/cholesterol/gamma-HCH transport system substrate-binding protein